MSSSLNTFKDHAPKKEWIKDFFQMPETFFNETTLSAEQQKIYRKFLRRAGLIEKKTTTTTELFKIVQKIGWDEATTWGIMLVNLVYDAREIRWYVETLPPEVEVSRKSVEEKLRNLGISVRISQSIARAYKRFCRLPMGTELKFGTYKTDVKNKKEMWKRTKAKIEDSRVVLYALYKFAESYEGGWHQFSLNQLQKANEQSAGVSPMKIFVIGREEMRHFLNELSAKYPKYINASFTFDLEKISLSPEKTSQDVLKLFEWR